MFFFGILAESTKWNIMETKRKRGDECATQKLMDWNEVYHNLMCVCQDLLHCNRHDLCLCLNQMGQVFSD
jgi:hypothetical protein